MSKPRPHSAAHLWSGSAYPGWRGRAGRSSRRPSPCYSNLERNHEARRPGVVECHTAALVGLGALLVGLASRHGDRAAEQDSSRSKSTSSTTTHGRAPPLGSARERSACAELLAHSSSLRLRMPISQSDRQEEEADEAMQGALPIALRPTPTACDASGVPAHLRTRLSAGRRARSSSRGAPPSNTSTRRSQARPPLPTRPW